ncbi:levansucrase [Streptomyces durbertensis]|uniref:Levansucrase n=1 Tax=Streptomyces durbertensis TaxID=2448886 RepID=A0ABR6EHV0_9ACTN|nr:levansucrase [Streptomyces durbertensis]MBB1244916.1 levansucrase [Streptomyces durbertensis]
METGEARIAQTYLAGVAERLAGDGCSVGWDNWAGAPVLVGRRADFRLRWAATRLHLFTIAAEVPEITVPVIDSFTRQAMRYAKDHKGGLPVGLQTGVAVFPVLVSDRVDPAAMWWAMERQRMEFACMARPAVVDTARRAVGYYRGKPVVGRFYAHHQITKGDRYLTAPDWPLVQTG